jgi:cytochrome c oxidase subunit II
MSRTRRAERLGAALAPLLLAACDARMSMFRPASPEAARISRLTWFLVVAAAVVYVVVIAFLVAAILRRRRGDARAVDLAPTGSRAVIVGGAVIPGIILVAIFILGLGAMRTYPTADGTRLLTYEVTGHQWWWDVVYRDPTRGVSFRTANEIHVPVGQPVQLTLVSADVIHSFWVPQLQGKIDLIPGDTNSIRFVASKPGRYRGQCAEYCGTQHAHMALVVVAEDSATFRRWVAAQRQASVAPADSEALLGQRLVVGGPCALCHTIGGTSANATFGPDLTHVGSRLTLAAGELPNDPATMEAWITNAQSLKPGAQMPSITQFNGRELRAMATYLESLK